MKELEQIKVWEELKACINKIIDQKTRKMAYRALLVRFMKEYGFNPEKPVSAQKNNASVDLDDWEQELLNDIKDSKTFGFDTREEKRKKTAKEAHARMMQFIETGGTLADIPEDIRTDTIINLYHDCMQEYGNNLLAEADRLIGVQQ